MISNYLKQLQQTNNLIGKHLPWLLDIQKTSLEKFIAQGFPDRHQENWKYTDLTFLAKKDLAWTTPEHVTNHRIALPYLIDSNFDQLVFIDGYFCSALSKIEELQKHVQLLSLREVIAKNPEQIAPYLKISEDYSSLTHLNTALMLDGLFLQIEKNTQLDRPIHLLFLSTQPATNTMMNIRNIIVLAENAQASLFEEHISINEKPLDEVSLFKNIFTEIVLKENSRLNYYKLQQEHQNTIHTAQTNVYQAGNSYIHSQSVSLGAKIARDDLNINLNEASASCELNGLYLLSNQQHIDHHTRIDHNAAHTNSHECYKGILKDHAKGVFNGKIVVHPEAQKTKSALVNKNLLLSSTAEMNTKPELEIYADDVQCTHGATVGQIDAEPLFYLRSRGLDLQDAMKLLINAFYHEGLDKIANTNIKQCIETAVAKKIVQLQ